MATETEHRCRLCLVTPVDRTADDFAPHLAAALSAGDVATLFIAGSPTQRAEMISACTEMAQSAGVAVIVQGDIEAPARSGVDGLQIDLADLPSVPASVRRDYITGVEGLTTRHAAMAAGETDTDYLFFGRMDGEEPAGIFPPALELASWWASVAIVPSVIMGGHALASIDDAARSGIDFVALGQAIWADDRGAAAAMSEALGRLQNLVSAA